MAFQTLTVIDAILTTLETIWLLRHLPAQNNSLSNVLVVSQHFIKNTVTTWHALETILVFSP